MGLPSFRDAPPRGRRYIATGLKARSAHFDKVGSTVSAATFLPNPWSGKPALSRDKKDILGSIASL